MNFRTSLLFLFLAMAGTGCVQTVEPDAEDELLMEAQENVAAMPRG